MPAAASCPNESGISEHLLRNYARTTKARTYAQMGLPLSADSADDVTMRLAVRFTDGSLRPAILLMAIGTRMRVSIPGFDDAVELRAENGHWFDEAGSVVAVEFDLPEREFASLVQETADACDNRSDALEIHLWSVCVPKRSSLLRVN